MTDRTTTLILVPTEKERQILEVCAGWKEIAARARVELCGFGAVAAAARASRLVASSPPARILLVGLAGTLNDYRFPVGQAVSGTRVLLDGVGVGLGAARQGPREVGFPQWAGEGDPVWGELPLAAGGARSSAVILTVCAASADETEAADRQRLFSAAAIEDMESFGVALAGHLAEIPVSVIRGVSNVAGNRDPSTWKTEEALAAAAEAVANWLE